MANGNSEIRYSTPCAPLKRSTEHVVKKFKFRNKNKKLKPLPPSRRQLWPILADSWLTREGRLLMHFTCASGYKKLAQISGSWVLSSIGLTATLFGVCVLLVYSSVVKPMYELSCCHI